MRNRCFHAVLALIILLAGAVPAAAQDGLSLLPEAVQGIVTIKNLKHLYATLGIEELRAERPDEFGFLSDEIIEDVGIDLLDPAALEAEGFEMSRPLHVGIITDPTAAVVVLVPGKGNARNWVRAKMEEQGVRFTRNEKIDGVAVEGDEADEVACFERKGYIGIVVTNHEEGGGSAVETVRGLLKKGGGAVTASDSYRKTMARLPADSDVTFYMGPNLRSQMSKWGRSEEDLAEYGLTRDDMESWERDLGIGGTASAYALTIAPDRLTMDGYSWLGKDSKARDWLVVDTDPVSFLNRTPSEPWLASMTRIDFSALWTAIQPMLERARNGEDGASVREAFAKTKAETGIDVEVDIIGQLRGNLGLLISRAALMGTDLVILAQVRDTEHFQGTVDAITALGRAELEKKASENPDASKPQAEISEDVVNGVKVYRIGLPPMAELVYGIIDDHFVVASSSIRFESIANGGPGFVASIKNEPVRAALADPKGSVFYIDFRALSRDAEGILPMLGPKGASISQVLAELSELAVASRVDDEGVVQVSTLTSTRPGIWKYLIGLFVGEMDKVQNR